MVNNNWIQERTFKYLHCKFLDLSLILNELYIPDCETSLQWTCMTYRMCIDRKWYKCLYGCSVLEVPVSSWWRWSPCKGRRGRCSTWGARTQLAFRNRRLRGKYLRSPSHPPSLPLSLRRRKRESWKFPEHVFILKTAIKLWELLYQRCYGVPGFLATRRKWNRKRWWRGRSRRRRTWWTSRTPPPPSRCRYQRPEVDAGTKSGWSSRRTSLLHRAATASPAWAHHRIELDFPVSTGRF